MVCYVKDRREEDWTVRLRERDIDGKRAGERKIDR